MADEEHLNPESVAAQSLGWIDEKTRAIAPPLHLSSTFERDADNQYRSGRSYARDNNPAFDQVEAVLNVLERGEEAIVFSSGMAAASAVFMALSPGDHVVAPRAMYWLLRQWLLGFAKHWGLRTTLVDMTDLNAVRAAIEPSKTRLIWAETPANPLWDITDIEKVADLAHRGGARLAIDSTAATPVFTQPLTLGADIVMHSATKYLNGHSDLVAGALVTAQRDAYWERIKAIRVQSGGILGSFEAWLLLRGMRTLFPRVRTASHNAQMLAEALREDPHIASVLYPGLPGFPGHAVAARQMKGGFGGMLSIRIKGGETAAIATAAHVKLWKRATSLGGTESLMEHRASVEGKDTPCPPDLLRLSAGIESASDLLDDLKQALAIAHR